MGLTPCDVAVVGGGPAGLMAAERLAAAGRSVTVFERMPSVGRKFLLAGRGGLNLTHSEPFERLLGRYGPAAGALRPALEAFGPDDLRAWCEGLGQEVFVGSSGRVFPVAFKASPLLRAWLGRLAGLGVAIRTRHHWLGWAGEALVFGTPEGTVRVRPAATVLALGGASWPRLGSDGSWVPILRAAGVAVSDLAPANMGVRHPWSDAFRMRFAGAPLKRIAARVGAASVRGEAVITASGLEGGVIYALSRPIRDALAQAGEAVLVLDLRPDLDAAAVQRRMAGPGLSRANALRRAGLAPVAAGLVRETGGAPKCVTLRITATEGLERAISTAGGVRLGAGRPGLGFAGEMLDWDAPTGGYLLQATFSTAVRAAERLLSGAGW